MKSPSEDRCCKVTIDCGNSLTKVCFWRNDGLPDKRLFSSGDIDAIINFVAQLPPFYAIVSSVGAASKFNAGILQELYPEKIFNLDSNLPLPIEIACYSHSLGADRIAALAGSYKIADRRAALAVDCGTAMTLDLIDTSGVFRGGNISPGLRMRFKALNEYTGLLPLVDPDGEVDEFGHNTDSAIRDGVVMGMIYEIEETLKAAERIVGSVVPVITGGDASGFYPFLEKRGARFILEPLLVDIGLLEILNYNLSKK